MLPLFVICLGAYHHSHEMVYLERRDCDSGCSNLLVIATGDYLGGWGSHPGEGLERSNSIPT